MNGRASKTILLLLLAAIPSRFVAQAGPNLVYDSTGQLVPAGKTSAPARPPLPLQTRRGPWFNLGLGYGSVDCGNSSCTMDAPTGEIAAGWAVSPRFLLGGGITGWTKEGPTGEAVGERLRVTVGSLDLRARFYPTQTAGFFITGGLGIGMIRFSDQRGISSTHTGGAFLGGIGCDFRMTSDVSLTPFAEVSAVRPGAADYVRATVWRMGLGLTIH